MVLISASVSQISPTNAVVVQQIGSRAFVDDLAGFQHVGAVGNGKRHLRVLFHQQNGGALLIQVLDDLKDCLLYTSDAADE